MIIDILTQGGYDVVAEAKDGLEAVEKYKELKPDLVTMDLVMPEMSGLDALREIVKVDAAARVLMCTAVGQEAMKTEAKQAGALGFITKPFKPEHILDAMSEAV
jgi:two-component system chemotaxis response regulator CheY